MYSTYSVPSSSRTCLVRSPKTVALDPGMIPLAGGFGVDKAAIFGA